MTIILDISPVSPTLWQAEIDGEVIGTYGTPMLSTARALVARGVPAETTLAMRRKGSTQLDMTGTVGACAKLTVAERPNGPRVEPWKAFGAPTADPPAAV